MNGLGSGDVFRNATNGVIAVLDGHLLPGCPLVSVMMSGKIPKPL